MFGEAREQGKKKKAHERPMAEQTAADHTKGPAAALCLGAAGVTKLEWLEWVVPTSLPKLLYRKLHRRAV